MSEYVVQQGFEIGGREYWAIFSADGRRCVGTEKSKERAELIAGIWNKETAMLRQQLADANNFLADWQEFGQQVGHKARLEAHNGTGGKTILIAKKHIEILESENESLRQQLAKAQAENAKMKDGIESALELIEHPTSYLSEVEVMKLLRQALQSETSVPEAEAIELGYYRQILAEALRVINELHLSGGTRYSEEWLAKANAFMNGNAAPVVDESEICMDEEVAKLAKHQASNMSAAQLRHMESYRKSLGHQEVAPKYKVGDKVRIKNSYTSHHGKIGEVEDVNFWRNRWEYGIRFETVKGIREFLEAELEPYTEPAMPQDVTLSAEEIDWFAKHYVDHDEFRLLPEEGYVDWLDNKAVRFYTSLTKGALYELREAFNTPANHAAIAKRRDELKGLGRQS